MIYFNPFSDKGSKSEERKPDLIKEDMYAGERRRALDNLHKLNQNILESIKQQRPSFTLDCAFMMGALEVYKDLGIITAPEKDKYQNKVQHHVTHVSKTSEKLLRAY